MNSGLQRPLQAHPFQNDHRLQVYPYAVDLLQLHQQHPERYPFLLQSVKTSAQHAFDILFAFPQQHLQLQNNRVLLDGQTCEGDFLHNLDLCWRQHAGLGSAVTGLPFYGGWFVYLGYELAHQIEPKLQLYADASMPTAMAVRIPAAILRDHANERMVLFAETAFAHTLGLMKEDLAGCENAPTPVPVTQLQQLIEAPAGDYLAGVKRIKEYILAGDVFQVNLARRWTAIFKQTTTAAQVYRRLCQANPAPFAGIAQLAGGTIISSSPERLLSRRGDIVQTRPIAGTRPRSPSASQDLALAEELLLNAKERAEHIMLIDLERNDLGRICRPGTVQVDELMALESYAHVHHIVSNLKGELKPHLGPGEVIRALFPGGTITGCPKVRCMEIIAEIERCSRGAYTGSMGYLNRDGSMDLNILIRTLVYRDGHVEFATGAGIVHDSDPEFELQETRAKAKGLCLAL